MASIVIDHLYAKYQNDASINIAYLYCNFRRQGGQRPVDLLTSLLKQLVQRQPSIPGMLKSLFERHKDQKTRPSFDEISKVLQSIMTDYQKVFIIIDALDECNVSDGDRAKFLSEVHSLQAKTGLCLFATSRFIPDIQKDFQESAMLEIRASRQDVERYLEGHIQRLPSFVSRSPALQDEIKTGIVQAVDGM